MPVILAALFVGLLVLCSSITKAAATPMGKTFLTFYAKYNVKTTLGGGDMKKALQSNLLSIYKRLATGTVPGDKYTWSFENAPFYVDDVEKKQSETNLYSFANLYCRDIDSFVCFIDEDSVALFDLYQIGHTSETREIKNSDGSKIYRSAITGIYVEKWSTPDGVECSRQEALAYFNETQKKVKSVVSKVLTVHQKTGKPLTTIQRLKWIHDWLAINIQYDHESLNAWDNGAKGKDSIFNEYGALIKGKAVCKGYAYAYESIIKELVAQTKAKVEVETVICFGEGGGHGWNRVRLNGKWYHVDVTLDDYNDWSGIRFENDYFLVSDKALLLDHPGGISGYYTNYPVRATDRKYENKEWPAFFRAKISGTAKSTKKYKLGKKKAVCPFDGEFYPFKSIYRYSAKSTNLKMDKDLSLYEDVDYTVKYRNNRKKGWATAIITLKGQYKGKITIKFKIVK